MEKENLIRIVSDVLGPNQFDFSVHCHALKTVRVCVFARACMYVWMDRWIDECVCACVYVGVFVCVCVYVRVQYMCVCV